MKTQHVVIGVTAAAAVVAASVYWWRSQNGETDEKKKVEVAATASSSAKSTKKNNHKKKAARNEKKKSPLTLGLSTAGSSSSSNDVDSNSINDGVKIRASFRDSLKSPVKILHSPLQSPREVLQKLKQQAKNKQQQQQQQPSQRTKQADATPTTTTATAPTTAVAPQPEQTKQQAEQTTQQQQPPAMVVASSPEKAEVETTLEAVFEPLLKLNTSEFPPELVESLISLLEKSISGAATAEDGAEIDLPDQLFPKIQSLTTTQKQQLLALLKSQQEEEEKKLRAETLHIVLLGPSQSGKSTFLKQLLILCGQDPTAVGEGVYTANQLREHIWKFSKHLASIFGSNKQIVSADAKQSFEALNNMKYFSYSYGLDEHIARVWRQTKQAYEDSKYSLEIDTSDNIASLMDDVKEIWDLNYELTDSVVLRDRTPTIGIQTLAFPIGEQACEVSDVGGTIKERKKWHSEGNKLLSKEVDLVIFFVSLTDYAGKRLDTAKLSLDSFVDSIQLATETLSSPYLRNDAKIVLLLTKEDLFQEKVKRVPLQDVHGDYKGDTVDDAKAFILKKFDEVATKTGRQFTMVASLNALEMDQVKRICESIAKQVPTHK